MVPCDLEAHVLFKVCVCVSFINGSRWMALFPEAQRSGHPIAAPRERSKDFDPFWAPLGRDNKSGDCRPAHPPAVKAGEDDLLLGGAL